MFDTTKFVLREEYLSKIEKFIDRPIIKVLKGMRRVGKSVIIKLLIEKLIHQNVSIKNIVYINKESLEFEDIKNYKNLYIYVNSILKNKIGKKYIIIDEIQEIEEWEKAVSSFYSENIADIIISGSNAKLLSTELATLLSGRYVEINIYPLTFKEFLAFRNSVVDVEKEFKFFLRYGGLPGIHLLSFEDEAVFSYLNSILNTVIYKDIIIRNNIRNAVVLDRVIKYLFDNIGNITTAKKIADYYKSQRLRISVDTIINYIKFIETSLLINRVQKYDIKGKKYFEFFEKVFLNDIGLRHGLIGYHEKDINCLLENVVYHELRVRGYKISIGVIGQLEIDFIAEKQNDKKYIQVCYNLSSNATIEREFGNLEKIRDNYNKIVISMDKFFPEERNGIRHLYLIDFLQSHQL